jgi:hypothetical protein
MDSIGYTWLIEMDTLLAIFSAFRRPSESICFTGHMWYGRGALAPRLEQYAGFWWIGWEKICGAIGRMGGRENAEKTEKTEKTEKIDRMWPFDSKKFAIVLVDDLIDLCGCNF